MTQFIFHTEKWTRYSKLTYIFLQHAAHNFPAAVYESCHVNIATTQHSFCARVIDQWIDRIKASSRQRLLELRHCSVHMQRSGRLWGTWTEQNCKNKLHMRVWQRLPQLSSWFLMFEKPLNNARVQQRLCRKLLVLPVKHLWSDSNRPFWRNQAWRVSLASNSKWTKTQLVLERVITSVVDDFLYQSISSLTSKIKHKLWVLITVS